MKNEQLKKEIGLVKAEGLYKSVLLLSFLTVIASIVISFLMYLKTEKTIKDITSKVVVLDGNGSVSSGSVKEVNSAELSKLQCLNVLRLGVEYLFSFSTTNYDDRISMGRAYWGKSGNEILQGYVNENVRDKIMQNNLRVDIVIQSIDVQIESNVLVGKVSFEQSFVNGSAIQKRIINATCVFEKSQVSNKNAYGYIIENWLLKN
jgi:hypothetical protein